jgi:hypothetical protein
MLEDAAKRLAVIIFRSNIKCNVLEELWNPNLFLSYFSLENYAQN